MRVLNPLTGAGVARTARQHLAHFRPRTLGGAVRPFITPEPLPSEVDVVTPEEREAANAEAFMLAHLDTVPDETLEDLEVLELSPRFRRTIREERRLRNELRHVRQRDEAYL
jgi:hypothetical protein